VSDTPESLDGLAIRRRITLGSAICLTMAALAVGPAASRLGWLEILFAAGAFVLTPLGIGLIIRDSSYDPWQRAAWRSLPYTAGLLVVAMFVSRGAASGILAIPWVLNTILVGARWLFDRPTHGSRDEPWIARAASLLCLIIGAMTLASWRADMHPFGRSDVQVHVTAALFAIAGFGVLVLAAEGAGVSDATARDLFVTAERALLVALVVVVIGLADVFFRGAGCALIGVATLSVCGATVREARPMGRSLRKLLLMSSAAGGAVPVGLGVIYGVSRAIGGDALSSADAFRAVSITAVLLFLLPGLVARSLQPAQVDPASAA
jgi:YndJ-like protein